MAFFGTLKYNRSTSDLKRSITYLYNSGTSTIKWAEDIIMAIKSPNPRAQSEDKDCLCHNIQDNIL